MPPSRVQRLICTLSDKSNYQTCIAQWKQITTTPPSKPSKMLNQSKRNFDNYFNWETSNLIQLHETLECHFNYMPTWFEIIHFSPSFFVLLVRSKLMAFIWDSSRLEYEAAKDW